MLARRMIPALACALLALAAPVAVAAGPRAHVAGRRHRCVNADARAAGAPRAALRTAVICLINHQRAKRGLPALHESPRLDRSAQHWTDAMVATGAFTHGQAFSARITAVGFIWSDAGENIATGFRTPREVVNGWMGSTDHCRNILDPIFADVGTGVSDHPVGGIPQGATWTQDFGLWMGHRAPSSNYAPANGCPYR